MKSLGRLIIHLILAINVLFIALMLLSAYSPYIEPDKHPIQSCLGLLFPVFILINISFFIFWIIVQYKLALFTFIGFACCYTQIRTYIPVNFSNSDPPKECLKVLSYNVMGFNNLKLTKGENPILAYMKDSKADIICIQEYAYSQDKRYVTQKKIEQYLQAYPYKNIQNIGEKESTNKIACYSKYPILSSTVLRYKSAYNGSVRYELKVKNDTLTLINNHLESNKLTKEDKVIYEEMINSPEAQKVKSGSKLLITKLAEASAIRALQARKIHNEITSSKHKYIIVCGDFNDTPISYTHRIIAKGLKEAFTESGTGLGISYNQNKFFFRIDNILISKNFKAYKCTVDHSIKDSDHYPIWCYISKQQLKPI
ncbi:endonuclease/exonuclease/phosphatase family protein [uncultured Bacteroides sp.]|uniref:endonuclease/exonuclease/phosphatase family protein n=1 Tax=uncultured Bacteroides sp. TaxID=162156 RepID=UPI002AAB641C|nr:endonuclease/exonuclease/phosphatase family protein [uncultured Bacteroides sp.]